MSAIKVLSVASEIYPLIKTGGLADVTGALPAALAVEGVSMQTLVPGYPAVLAGLADAVEVTTFADLFGGPARLLHGTAGSLDLLIIDAPHLYNRPGNPYSSRDGQDWPDNPFRFAALGWIASEIGLGLVPGIVPDVVHAHDWQGAMAAVYLHYDGRPRPGTVISVHNLAFQGICDASLLNALRLPPNAFTLAGVEYYGGIGFLKGGLQLADQITTVSPTYAVEILGPEAGMGLDGLLKTRSNVISGILNGLDGAVWDPASDPHLAARYRPNAVQNARAKNRKALQARLGLHQTHAAPLIGVISRLSQQKGLDLLLEIIPMLLREGIQLALLGAGEIALQQGFARAAAAHPQAIGCAFTYDEPLAHMIQGGADAFLVPSRFEPCGLTQLAALRYGAVPVVARVGGLADTIIDANPVGVAAGVATGIQFAPVSREALESAIRRVLALWQQPKVWRTLQANGMSTDVSWRNPARQYASLYQRLLAA